jgi:hypothetical protein
VYRPEDLKISKPSRAKGYTWFYKAGRENLKFYGIHGIVTLFNVDSKKILYFCCAVLGG